MLSFADAVRDTIERIYGRLDADDEEVRYVCDPCRIEETAAAAPLADAFARAELRPAGKGLGIHGANMIPAVGAQLTKKLGRADAAAALAVEDAVRRAMSTGYVGFLSVEAPSGISLADEFDPPQAWDVMVHNFRGGGLARLGMPAELCRSIEGFGQEALVSDLRAAGLLGRRSGRVGLVGRYYAIAGGFLRAAQTDFTLPMQVQAVASVLGERWPYEHYARA